jgi:two-component system chemotaxis response regulator CheB
MHQAPTTKAVLPSPLDLRWHPKDSPSSQGSTQLFIVLSGFLDDGNVGPQAIKVCGCIAMLQDSAEAEAPNMPAAGAIHLIDR